MRILVNYSADEANYLPILRFHIKNQALEAIATPLTLSLGELVNKAANSNCQAIFLVNEHTLVNCVPGDKPTLDAYRGSVLQTTIPIVVGNSLAHSHTVTHGSWLLELDLKKLTTARTPKTPFKFEVIENEIQMEEAYNYLSNCGLIAYDIETLTVNGDKKELLAPETVISCVSWTGVGHDLSLKTYVLPMVDFGVDHWLTDQQYGNAIACLRRINATDVPKAMHHGAYDAMHSIMYRAYPRNWIIDTMGMAHSQYSELPKTLDMVASITLPDYIQWKGESVAAHKQKDIHRYWQYNGLDTHNTARIALYYLWNLPAYARTNYQMLFPLVYPALYCAFEGMLLDNTERLRLLAIYEKNMEELLVRIRAMVADPNFNPSSPKQVADYVYDVFGAADPHIGKKKKGNRSVRMTRGTDKKNLKSVGTQHPILLRLCNAILNYKEDRKAVSTYFTFLQKNNRLLYNLNPFGTDTGRMSCNSSSLWCGTQMQNIPGYAKTMMIADLGFYLIEGDKSQSEARCTAYLAQDLNLIKSLEGDLDFYTSLGDLFFTIKYEDVTKELRQLLKKICHGTNYVMGAQTFLDNADTEMLLNAAAIMKVPVTMGIARAGQISLKQFSGDLLEAYHKPFNRIRPWYTEVKTEISSTHMLVSPLGYSRYFFGDINKNHNILRSAIAHGPQNLSVLCLNRGFMKVWQLVKKYPKDIRLKAQIHDSVLAQIREGRDDIEAEFKLALEDEMLIHGRKLIIPNDYKKGKAWIVEDK